MNMERRSTKLNRYKRMMEAGGHKYINVMPLDKYRKGSVRTIKRNLKQMEMYRKWIKWKNILDLEPKASSFNSKMVKQIHESLHCV